MKLLYSVILLLAATQQLVRAKPLNVSFILNNTLPIEDHLQLYYDIELNLLAPEICVKLKNITEQLLKDQTVQQATTFVMKEFKNYITRFQEIYPFYTHFGLNGTLISTFSDMIGGYYYLEQSTHNDSLYILQLIRKLGYDEIRDKYKTEFKKLVSEKFVLKFEELKRQNTNNTGLNTNFIKWVDKLKECQEYECYFSKFERKPPNALERLIGDIFSRIIEAIFVYSFNTGAFSKGVLNDPKLSQLSPAFRQEFIQNLKNFIAIFDSIDNMGILFVLPEIYHCVIFKFDNYAEISTKDRQLITKIFDDQGYRELGLNKLIEKEDSLTEHDYLKEFENTISSLNQEILTKFLAAIDRLQHATTPQERDEAIKNIYGINLRKFKDETNE